MKPRDGHQFLHCKSSHHSHIKNSIPYTQALRISRICSSQNGFNGYISNLKDWFLARDYCQKVVKPSRKDTSEQGVSFIATYHPKLKGLLEKLIKT